MRKILICTMLAAAFSAQAQIRTVGVTYTAGAPTFTPSSQGSFIAYDTTGRDFYEFFGGVWTKTGQVIDQIAGAVAPAYTPTKMDSRFAINASGELYWYSGVVWVQVNGVTDLTFSGSASPFTLNSSTGTDVTFAQGGIVTLSRSSNELTIGATEVDGSVSNEGVLGVGAGGANTSVITSNTSGANGVTISGTSAIAVTESTNSNGGTITIDVANDGVTFAKMQEISGQHLVGRHSSGSGDIQEVSVGNGIEFQGSGIRRSALTGDVTAAAGSGTTTIAGSAVTFAKIQDLTGLSVIGRSASTTGVTAAITPDNDHEVLRRSGSAIGFGAINLAQSNAVTGVLPSANGGDQTVSLTGTGITVGGTYPSFTLTAADQSNTNELQTLSHASDATSHTVTLSNTGGSLKLIEGSNITLTTNNTNEVTIAASGSLSGSGTNNTIPKWSASTTLGDSQITDDGTNVSVGGTSSFKVPSGTTAQRPVTPSVGMMRNNTSNNNLDFYTGSSWENPVKSSTANGLGTATQIGLFDANGRMSGQSTLTYSSGLLNISNNPSTIQMTTGPSRLLIGTGNTITGQLSGIQAASNSIFSITSGSGGCFAFGNHLNYSIGGASNMFGAYIGTGLSGNRATIERDQFRVGWNSNLPTLIVTGGTGVANTVGGVNIGKTGRLQGATLHVQGTPRLLFLGEAAISSTSNNTTNILIRRSDCLATTPAGTQVAYGTLIKAGNVLGVVISQGSETDFWTVSPAMGDGTCLLIDTVYHSLQTWSRFNDEHAANIDYFGNLIIGSAFNDTSSRVRINENSRRALFLAGSGVMRSNGKVGIGLDPTAQLHLRSGQAGATLAPLKFTSGTNMTTPEAGAMEWDGSNLFMTNSTPTRQTVNQGLTGSASLDFPNTNAGESADLTITVTGAADGDVVAIGVPNAAVNANTCYTAWVSAADTVTVRFNNYSGSAVNPASGTFKAFVTKF